jgi:hypothetical protein
MPDKRRGMEPITVPDVFPWNGDIEMPKTPEPEIDKRRNRDEDLKVPAAPGRPPRPATEPDGAEAGSANPHTRTDPATGQPNRSR